MFSVPPVIWPALAIGLMHHCYKKWPQTESYKTQAPYFGISLRGDIMKRQWSCPSESNHRILNIYKAIKS